MNIWIWINKYFKYFWCFDYCLAISDIYFWLFIYIFIYFGQLQHIFYILNILYIKSKIVNIFKYINLFWIHSSTQNILDTFEYPKYFGSGRIQFRFSKYQNFKPLWIFNGSDSVLFFWIRFSSVRFFGFWFFCRALVLKFSIRSVCGCYRQNQLSF